MRYAPEHNEETRARILAVAARLFREHGVDSVGLAKVMTESGLTIGTFYTHFESKEALLQAALQSLEAQYSAMQQTLLAGNVEGAVRAYLSRAHRDAAGAGCPAAALAAELSRRTRATRKTLLTTMEPTLEALAAALGTHRGKAVTRAEASAFFGLLVGTLQLARATPSPAESDAVLEAGIAAALQLAGSAPR